MTKAKTTTPDKILLGYGIVEIDGSPVGLTRGGSTFNVERTFRNIEADGDRGPVKGRIAFDSETAKLVVNALEIFDIDTIKTVYAAMGKDTNVLSSKPSISEDDYHQVVWRGKTHDGSEVVIELPQAISLSNLDFTFEDKNEVVPALEFTATYKEDSRDESSYSITFGSTTPDEG
ncbi:hypothetical protein AOC36_09535 [Erysipelothrix larvae]|uniref:Phage tail protein n=1 Tax=Erysipelothrix larvae TaxID=1514105 RepID=A0A109UHG8_9FIRM|nr:hypothetical protein [Erysipelothrix larvae]AMC94215.1 hypothetical protein AOC36_09535 [Erysipelothrix larvae]